MKTKLTLAIMIATILACGNIFAQVNPAVKILPSANEGIFKVLYAYDTDRPVEINFINEDGVIISDRVKAAKFRHGFLKKYDVTKINSKNFWIEVKADNLSVTYKMTRSDKGTYQPLLEKTIFHHDVVAKNN